MFFLNHKSIYSVALSALLGMALPAVAAESTTFTSKIEVSQDVPDACVTAISVPEGGTAIDVLFNYDNLEANGKGALSPAGSSIAPRYISIVARGGASCTISGIKVDTTVTTGKVNNAEPSGTAMQVPVGSKGANWVMAPIVAHVKSEQVLLDGPFNVVESQKQVSIKDGTKTFTYTSGDSLSDPQYGTTSVAGIASGSHPYYATQTISASGPNIVPMAREGKTGQLTVTPEAKYGFRSADIGVGLVMAALPMNNKNEEDKNAVADGDTANIGFTVTVTEI